MPAGAQAGAKAGAGRTLARIQLSVGDGQETPVFRAGEKARLQISVKNSGNMDAQNVRIAPVIQNEADWPFELDKLNYELGLGTLGAGKQADAVWGADNDMLTVKDDVTGKADDMRREISATTREKNDALLKKEELEAKLQKTKTAREKAVEELKVLNAKTYQPTPEPENASICPHCGQRLPDHMLKDAHEAYLKAEDARKKAFLQELEKEKAEVIERGKTCSGDVIKAIETELSAIGDRITELEDSISSKSSELDKVKAEADRLESDLENARKAMKAPVAFEDTEEGKALLERKDVYQKAVDEGENGMVAANVRYTSTESRTASMRIR